MSNSNKLFELLSREANSIDDLVQLMKKKKDAIISLTYDSLQNIVSEEIKLVNFTKNLEKERLLFLKDLNFNGKEIKDITMTEIISRIDTHDKERFMELKNRFKKSLDELKDLNETNMYLIDRSKKFIKDNISIITDNGTRQIINTKI